MDLTLRKAPGDNASGSIDEITLKLPKSHIQTPPQSAPSTPLSEAAHLKVHGSSHCTHSYRPSGTDGKLSCSRAVECSGTAESTWRRGLTGDLAETGKKRTNGSGMTDCGLGCTKWTPL